MTLSWIVLISACLTFTYILLEEIVSIFASCKLQESLLLWVHLTMSHHRSILWFWHESDVKPLCELMTMYMGTLSSLLTTRNGVHWSLVDSSHKRPIVQSFDACSCVRRLNELLNKRSICGCLRHHGDIVISLSCAVCSRSSVCTIIPIDDMFVAISISYSLSQASKNMDLLRDETLYYERIFPQK